MNKRNLILSTVASLTIVAASMPFVAFNTPTVSAATSCIDISDDFSSDSGMWKMYASDGTIDPLSSERASIVNGEFVVAIDSEFQSRYTLTDPATNEPMLLYGDWELNIDLSGYSHLLNSPHSDIAYYSFGTGVGSTVNSKYNFVRADIESRILGFGEAIDNYAEYPLGTYSSSFDTITVKFVKSGDTIVSYYSINGDTFTELVTETGVSDPVDFSIYNSVDIKEDGMYAEASYDNFSVKCGESTIPTPEPTTCVDFTDNFTTTTSEKNWYSENSLSGAVVDNGTYMLMAEKVVDGYYYGEAVYNDPTTTAYAPVKFNGDWTLSIDLNALMIYSSDWSKNPEGGTSFELFDDNNTYRIGIQATEEKNAQVYSYAHTVADPNQSSIYSGYVPELMTNYEPVSLIFKKTGTDLELSYIDSTGNPVIISTYNDVPDILSFKTYNIFTFKDTSPGGSTNFDNFSLSCGTPEPTPQPEAIDTTTPFNVQRFFNIRIGSAHFYSIDPVEAKFVEDNSKAGGLWPGAFVKEAPTFAAFNYDSVNDKCMDGTSPVYRYLNRTTGDTHFYAIKADEISAVEGQFASTFKKEGAAFCAYLDTATGAKPVYRWQNKILGSTHFYSADPTERDYVDTQLTSVFNNEGVAFYAMPVQ